MIDILQDCTLHILTDDVHPKDEAERKERERNPRHLATRLMFCDLLNN